MQIKFQYRVLARPVQATFPFPLQPSAGLTWFFGGMASVNNEDSSGLHIDPVADCVYARPLRVPCNNKVSGEGEYSAGGWYNTTWKTQLWTKSAQTGHLHYDADSFATPWAVSLWFAEHQARAAFYGHVVSDAGSSDIRNTYDPASSGITLTSGTYSGDPLKTQGVLLLLEPEMDAVKEEWSDASGTWVPTYTQPADSDTKPSTTVRFKCSSNAGGAVQYVTVVFNCLEDPSVWISSSSGSIGKKLIGKRPGDIAKSVGEPFGGFYKVASRGGSMMDVRLVGGFLQMNHDLFDGQVEVPMFDRDPAGAVGEPVLFITEVKVVASGIRGLKVALAPLMWYATGHLTCGQQGLGFAPVNSPTFMVRYAHSFKDTPDKNAVAGTTVTASLVLDGVSVATTVKPVLTLSGTVKGNFGGVDYSDRTAAVMSLTVSYREVFPPSLGRTIQLFPEEVSVDETFNPGTLELDRTATLVFENFREVSWVAPDAPYKFWGQIANRSGAFAVEIESAIEYWSNDGLNFLGWTGWSTLFTGWAALRSSTTFGTDGKSKHTVTCLDRSVTMRSPLFNMPWMDGYNHYYAAAELASFGGFRWDTGGGYPSDLAFLPYVPPVTTGAFVDAGDPSGAGAYFLPMGTGGSPLFKPPMGITAWDMLGRVGGQSGFMRYVDRQGLLHYEKFRLASSAFPYRVFKMVENEPEGTNGVFDSVVFGGVVTRDLTTVRNYISLVGAVDPKNPLRAPISAHKAFPETVYAPYATGPLDDTVPNFLGFKSAFVWFDSQFASLDYTNRAITDVASYISMPKIDANFATWHQPDLELGQRIGVRDVKTGTFDPDSGTYLEFMVVSLRHRLRLGVVPTTRVGVQYIPPGTGGSGYP